ncbi:MAG: GNAT family N-acetyltransferase [Clostridia bacterium]|nr:GNAT family N-acetyltransferase [Clostridia bacterium]
MIRLEKIDAENVWDILELNVAESQKKYVAPNSDSIIEAYTTLGTECAAFPFGVFDDDKPVGFVMVGYNLAALYEALDVTENNYLIWRLMIDQKYQKHGYGREAARLALDFIKTWPCGKAEYCITSYHEENEAGKKMYRSLGFAETGEILEGEYVMTLKL